MVSIISLKQNFFVALEDIFWAAEIITCGFSQGPISGLLLFLIYINDLQQQLNETGSYFNLEDTCIFYQD